MKNINFMEMAAKKAIPFLVLNLLLTLVLLGVVNFSGYAQGSILNKTVSINFNGQQLSEALALIGDQADISFVYNTNIINDEKKIYEKFKDVKVENILKSILKDTNVNFKEADAKIYFYLMLKASETPSEGGAGVIEGTIFDASSKKPVEYAHVFINNSTSGTYSDSLGHFSIDNLRNRRSYELIISHMAFENSAVQIKVADQSPDLKISLHASEKELDEVIVREKKDKKWQRNFKLFKIEFLGFSSLAMLCRIVNPWILEFQVQDNTLKAKATEPLIIENMATGYSLKFYLEHFSLNLATRLPRYYGYCSMEEKQTNNETIKKKWIKNRKRAFKGSFAHLIKSILQDDLLSEGFFINDDEIVSIDFDSLKNRQVMSIKLQDELEVLYLKEGESWEYLSWLNGVSKASMKDAKSNQTSVLEALDDEIVVDQNLGVLNQHRIVQSGHMGWERIAELLPIDFDPD